MASTKPAKKTKSQRMTFSLEAPSAREVSLGGDFNHWNPGAIPMNKNEKGIWKKAVVLPPGRYEYKFLIDGHWQNDPKNDQTCPNCFGTHNNVLNIS